MKYGSLFYLGFWGLIGVYDPFIYVYFANLGLNGQQIGILAALLPLAFLLIIPAISVLVDRIARRRYALRIALLGLAFTLLIYWLPQTFWPILFFTALLSLFRAPIVPLSDSMLTRMATRHDLNFGSMRLWGSFGFAAAAIIGGAIWQQTGFFAMFVAAGLIALPLIFVAGRLEEDQAAADQNQRSWTLLLRHPGMVAILAASFLIGGYMGLTFTFEGVYLNAIGGTEFVVGLYFGLGALFELPAMQFSDRLAHQIGRPKTLLIGYALLIFANLGKALAPTAQIFLLIGVLKGLGFGLFFVSTVRLVEEQSPPGWSTTAQGLLNAVLLGLASLLATPFGGWLYDRYGGAMVFMFGSGLAILAVIVIGFASIKGAFNHNVHIPLNNSDLKLSP